MIRRVVLAIVAIVAIVVIAGACGCGGSSSAPAGAAADVAPAADAAEAPRAAPAARAASAPVEPLPAPEPPAMSAEQTRVELRNRLGDETSPYLLQHRDNPVAWFAWGPEAFEAARALDRPIFLSIGYSTCYWCHVMERESFEDETTAKVMNEHFICIKVDREERPDVDDLYMAAVQLYTGQGGWPMSVFLEPDTLRPFIAGTYFPPEDLPGRPAFKTVLLRVAGFWNGQRDLVLQQAERLAGAVAEHLAADRTPVEVGRRDVEQAISGLLSIYDREDGGFTGASPRREPKFPMPATLDFLIGAAWDVEPARGAVLHTLDRMAAGGMYDQVGGGFHRYSTDAQWLVPHFEKMLYDNGQLASTYGEAYERTGDPRYARVVRETLDYVLREMTSPDGAFFSAQDAEVNHHEGRNYLWREAEVREVLEAAEEGDLADLAVRAYGLDRGTNFTDPHHPEDGASNVLFRAEPTGALAAAAGLEPGDVEERLRRIDAALLAARDARDQPLTDDKILASWNGLMIAGLADGGRVLGEQRYTEAAARAADWVLAEMRDADGGLLRTARAGQARIPAFLEDYACLVRGLLALHRAGERSYLVPAAELAVEARQRFGDEAGGGYFDTLADRPDLFVRSRATDDGAVPCGSSVMLLDLLDLHEATGDPSWLDQAVATLRSMSAAIRARPTGPILSTLALCRLLQAHPDRVPGGGTAVAEAAPPRPGAPVEEIRVRAEPRKVALADGGEATFDVRIEIGRGWHLNAHRPGIDFLVPLEITLVEGGGLAIEPQYPDGEDFAGPDGTFKVHQGTVVVPVTVRRRGRITGYPKIMMSYQLCNDRLCLAPDQKRVPVAIVEE